MKLLLDTHAFIWWDSDTSQLSPKILGLLGDPSNEVLLSVCSIWEMAIKSGIGKLTLRLSLSEIVNQQQNNGLMILDIKAEHVLGVSSLPNVHKDPFDRLLVAQAKSEAAHLVTADAILAKYPVKTVW